MNKTHETKPAKSVTGVSAKRLKDKKEEILCLWEERSLKEVPSAKTATTLALRDSLPLYLDHLSEALATNIRMDFKSIFARDRESSRIGKLHGSDRADNKSYALTEVIFEYHILREVIFKALEEKHGQLPENERDIIFDSIEQAVNDAAVEFSEIHTDVQQTFVNTLSHDLKNPITVAKMSAQMILRLTDVDDAALTSGRRIIGSMNRLESMIHDLLDVSRLRNGESLNLQVVECDLATMIREVADEMSLTHGDRFVVKSPERVKGCWDCDSLRRAVENLAGNAVKYSTPDSQVTLLLEFGKKAVELTVHNEGKPIAENEIPLLFQNFRRSKSANEGTKTGWGLGLTVVKGVIEAHKGKIRVESKEGKGTSFILEIPTSEVSPVSSGTRIDAIPKKKANSNQIHHSK
jgi:signal transduction histidine kinase